MWILHHLPPFLCMSPKQLVVWRKICCRKIPGSHTYCLPWASKPSVECHTAGHARTKDKQYLQMLKHYIKRLFRRPMRRRNPQYPWKKELLTHPTCPPRAMIPWPPRSRKIQTPKLPKSEGSCSDTALQIEAPSILRHSHVCVFLMVSYPQM